MQHNLCTCVLCIERRRRHQLLENDSFQWWSNIICPAVNSMVSGQPQRSWVDSKLLAPAGLTCSFRWGLQETVHWAPLLINVFSACLQPAQKPHVGVDLPALNPYFLFLSVFTVNEMFRRKDADIDWLVATLFWVAFHKWSRLLKK